MQEGWKSVKLHFYDHCIIARYHAAMMQDRKKDLTEKHLENQDVHM